MTESSQNIKLHDCEKTLVVVFWKMMFGQLGIIVISWLMKHFLRQYL